ncbi:MAG: hypothetical protein ACLGHN_04440 [Bacteriovoracia bacterium]
MPDSLALNYGIFLPWASCSGRFSYRYDCTEYANGRERLKCLNYYQERITQGQKVTLEKAKSTGQMIPVI